MECTTQDGAQAVAKKDFTPGGNLTQAYVDLLDAGNAQAQLLMKAIAQHADWKTGEAFPGVRSLAEIGKCSMKTVRRYLKRLEGDGLIALDQRYQDAEDENGRQTSSRITLMGYAEWAAAVRDGGTGRKPVRVRKYEGSPPGQPDQGGTGTPSEQQGAPPGQLDQGPLDNLSAPPGHHVSTPPGQQGDQGKNVTSNLVDNTPPLPPKRASRTRGARGRDQSQEGSEVASLLSVVHQAPGGEAVAEHLLAPILARRQLLAPDPAHVVAALTRWAVQFPVPALKAAAYRVLEERHSKVTEESIVAALRAVTKDVGQSPPIDRPAAPAAAADGLVTIREREHPEAYAAWMQHYKGLQHLPLHYATASTHRFMREATLFPPNHRVSEVRP